LIKRYPHCGLYWFKIEGCEGDTTCGRNDFTNRHDVTGKAFWKYQLTRIGGKLQWAKDILKETIQVSEDNTHNNTDLKPVGCGKGFKWCDLPKIDEKNSWII
jgi:hypothetical protein